MEVDGIGYWKTLFVNTKRVMFDDLVRTHKS